MLDIRKDFFANERDDNLNVVGKGIQRQDMPGHVTARSRFFDDHAFEGLLHLKVVRSPHHHARIRSIDTSSAERAPGVKRILRADDSLDVFGVHAVGGIVGSLLTGPLASKAVSGVTGSLWVQALGVGAVFGYAFVATAVLLVVTKVIVGLRVDEKTESTGLDIAQHRERLGA